MDISVITQLIGSLGFPIVCCLMLVYMYYQQDKRHAEESAKWAEAINNNTLALTKLSDKIGEYHGQ